MMTLLTNSSVTVLWMVPAKIENSFQDAFNFQVPGNLFVKTTFISSNNFWKLSNLQELTFPVFDDPEGVTIGLLEDGPGLIDGRDG